MKTDGNKIPHLETLQILDFQGSTKNIMVPFLMEIWQWFKLQTSSSGQIKSQSASG